MTRLPHGILGIALAGVTAIACSTTQNEAAAGQTAMAEKQREVTRLEQALRERESQIESQQSRIASLASELERSRTDVAAPAPPSRAAAAGDDLLPPAKPGQCFARALVPTQYDTRTERVLAREAGQKIEIVPARYDTVKQKVLVKEASYRIEEVPAVYETDTEKVLVKPAQTIWKKGRGPIERVDHATGEILCLVEEPAVYETVKKRVLKQPATTRKIEIPAEYRTVSVRKMVEPPREKRVDLPASYETVTQRVKTADARMEWRPVLCETNTTPELIRRVQAALRDAGLEPGPVDGQLGRRTLTAVRDYQRRKGLPTGGGLTLATLDSLGVQ